MVRYAWPTPAVACCLATSTSVTRTKVPAPMRVAGNTKPTKAKKMSWVILSTSTKPIAAVQQADPALMQAAEPILGVGAPTDEVFLIRGSRSSW